jgi:hypothetical protein
MACLSTTALAQTGQKAPPKGAVEREAPEATTPTNEPKKPDAQAEIADVSPFVAPEAAMLRELDLEASKLRRELANTELKAAIAAVGKEASAEGPGQTNRSFPELLGVSSARGKTHAEFLVGDGVIEFTVGDWITPEFKLSRINTTSVELRDRQGRASQMAVGVSRPVQGAMPAAAPAGAGSRMTVRAPAYPGGAVSLPSAPPPPPPE